MIYLSIIGGIYEDVYSVIGELMMYLEIGVGIYIIHLEVSLWQNKLKCSVNSIIVLEGNSWYGLEECFASFFDRDP